VAEKFISGSRNVGFLSIYKKQMTDGTSLKNLIENLVQQELDEMPIANYKTIGDFSKGSSIRNPVDRRLLSNPRAIEKIKRQWEKTPYTFDLYVMNDKRVNKEEFRERGEVSLEFVREKMKLTPEEFPDPPNSAITVIFTNNSGDERYMASGWILAHRVGHALARAGKTQEEWNYFTKKLRTLFNDLMLNVYGVDIGYARRENADKILKYVAQEIGSMKSARDNKMRSWYEFAYELLAQYMLTGKITLKPLPQSIVIGIAPFGRKATRSVQNAEYQQMYNNHDLDYYANGLGTYIDNVLDRAVGKILVM
jgi:hypothetical protein